MLENTLKIIKSIIKLCPEVLHLHTFHVFLGKETTPLGILFQQGNAS